MELGEMIDLISKQNENLIARSLEISQGLQECNEGMRVFNAAILDLMKRIVRLEGMLCASRN